MAPKKVKLAESEAELAVHMENLSYKRSQLQTVEDNLQVHALYWNLLLSATYHRAPRYGGVRTWVEGLLACGTRALAEASNLVGYLLGLNNTAV